MLCVPTVPTFVTVEEIARDPIGPNSQLGTYTNFVNLLDLCGIAVPAGERSDGKPGSLTVLSSSGRDAFAASLAAVIEAGRMGATDWERPAFTPKAAALQPDEIAVAACGAHMSGLLLNHELTSCGGRFVRASLTAPEYRFYALSGVPPVRPGLVRDPEPQASSIAVEIWAVPMAAFGRFMAGIPSPHCIGSVSLDGTAVKGFLCEAATTAAATEITSLGSWRRFIALQTV